MKKGALIVLGIVKIILGILLLGLGSGIGGITIFLGLAWIIAALVQKPNGEKKISEISASNESRYIKEDQNNQEVH